MEDLEIMRHITIGQYLPTGSTVHRLDPRAKLIGLGLLIAAVLAITSATGLAVALALILLLVALARVPLGFAAGGLRPALPVLLIIALLQLFFGWSGLAGADCQVLWSLWVLRLTTCSLLSVLAMLLRLVSLILLTGLLTMTSTISELNHGIESLLRPFARLGLPAHELAMIFTIALRFVPTLAIQLEKLLKAQVARGADIRLGANPLQRIRHFLPVLVPLFLTTLRRGDALAEAMEARGYSGSRGRSHYIRLHFSAADAAALTLVAISSAALLFIPFTAADRYLLSLLIRN